MWFAWSVSTGRDTPVSCSLGAIGVQVSITVRGPAAQAVCGRLLQAGTFGSNFGGAIYRLSSESPLPEICQIGPNDDLGSTAGRWLIITVHDGGNLQVLGHALCAGFQSSSTAPATAGFITASESCGPPDYVCRGSHQTQPAPQPVAPPAEECTLGLYHHNAAITVDGAGASAVCSRMAAGTADSFAAQGNASGTVICTFSARGLRYTVRDHGLTDTIGKNWCATLRQQLGV